FQWGNVYYASDYFQQLWDFAVWLIEKGLAYVDEQTSEQIAEQKGTPTEAGTNSPYRDRPVEENLALFKKMNTPEAVEGSMVLRAKLDMANPNMHFRDPIMYRIIHTPHHRTGTKWNAYPMYDFAHGQSDYFEGVTHSICTLEFVPHRPLYDKFIDYLQEKDQQHDYRPVQIEFNRLNLTYTIMSKRKLLALVEEKRVNGWDDPRMPTISGMRRRGYSPEGIRNFINSIGYTKFDALNDMALLEAAIREDLNARATRVSAVLNPVKLVITNYPENEIEEMVAINNPENEADGSHTTTFSKTLWIEREDFMEDAPKKFFRLTPGKEVRLKNAYIIMCTGCKKNEKGEIEEIYAEYDPESKSGREGASRKVKGTLHWLSTEHCRKAEVRIYDRLFNVENTAVEGQDFHELLNPDSLQVMTECYVEPYAAERKAGEYLQFQRIGYFMADNDSTPEHPIFNKTVGLKDSWAKINK
ncbi:MAG: glutamine--tRNA ligase, partial [Prevotella sp.]|nr:glutamine--tRNA ligase [Prevotella sp.]